SVDSFSERVTVPTETLKIAGLKMRMPIPGAQPLEVAGLRINPMLAKYDLMYTIGEYDTAYSMAQGARDILQRLPKSDQEQPQGLTLAYSISWRMAEALADQGNDPQMLERGLQEFAYAESLARKLAQMEPENGWRQRNIMFVLQKEGDIYQVEGDPDSAIAKYNEALEIPKKLVARPSPDPICKR